MSTTPTRPGGAERLLAALLAPLRLTERVIDAVDALTKAARNVAAIRDELVRVRELAEPLDDLLPALERVEGRLASRMDSIRELVVSLEGDESHLNTAAGRLVQELEAMHRTVSGLQDDVQRATDRLPDPERGPLQKARDVLGGSGS